MQSSALNLDTFVESEFIQIKQEIGLSQLTENAHQWFSKPILPFYQQVSNSWRWNIDQK